MTCGPAGPEKFNLRTIVMKLNTLQSKFVLVIAVMGVVLGGLLAIYAPYQSRSVGEDILMKDAEFISGLLAENLALSLQTISLDDGAALQQSLELLRNEEGFSTISDVLVFDNEMHFLKGLNSTHAGNRRLNRVDRLSFENRDDVLRARMPVKDMDNKTLGFVEIDFSKDYLNTQAAGMSLVSILIALIVVAAVMVPGIWVVRRISRSLDLLVRASKSMVLGDLDVDLDIRTGDEVETLAHSFKDILNAQKNKVNTAMEIANGNLDAEIQVLSDQDALGQAMLTMKQNLKLMTNELDQLTISHKQGDIEARCAAGELRGIYAQLMNSLNEALDIFAGPVLEGIDILQEYARGDLSREMRALPGKQIVLTEALNKIRRNLQMLIDEGLEMSRQASAGNWQNRGAADKFEGGYRLIVEGFNETLDAYINPLRVAAAIIAKISRGEMPRKINDDYQGDFNSIKENLNTCIDAINALVDDANYLIAGAMAGRLDTRVDGSKHQGDFRKIVDGINNTLDAVTAPVNELMTAMDQVAQGNLTAAVSGEFNGDFARLKEAFNASLLALNEALYQVSQAIDQMTSGAQQVADASQAVSQGATEQASSLEETSASMMQISAHAKRNAENASAANQLAITARNAADEGDHEMQNMLGAMKEINDSSAQISKIIKVIDEIAFQTNLLALNAAVEAARAGVHGKGFAVVAEEVRNLAQRSARAAKETEQLIEGTVQRVDKGTKIAHTTAQALGGIIDSISRAGDLVDEISSFSNEQVQGMEQINSALHQIDQVTQANSASAEESASAAEELSGQANQLKVMIGRFTIRPTDRSGQNSLAGNFSKSSTSKAASRPGAKEPVAAGHNGNGSNGHSPLRPEDIIRLDDDDFGDF